MVQPKKPPISIRLPDAIVAEVDAWAADHGMVRNAAIKALLELGLRRPVAASKPPARAVAAANREIKKALATPPKISVSVPLAGTFERKAKPKGQK